MRNATANKREEKLKIRPEKRRREALCDEFRIAAEKRFFLFISAVFVSAAELCEKIEKIAEKAAKNRKVFLQSLDSPGENVL